MDLFDVGTSPRPPRSRRAEGRLNGFIKLQSAAAGVLPLTHVTRAYNFDDMVADDALEPRYCSLFKEPLLYLFYGRPAYRAKDGNNARMEFEWPIVFIFDPSKVGAIRRVFPFDTGAFDLQLYKEFFSRDSILSDFSLDPDIDSARKVVGTLYVDHKEYYEGGTRKNVEIPPRNFELQGVHEMCRLPGVQGGGAGWIRDERSSAIELQLDHEIELKGALLAIILPAPYLNDPEITEALTRWDTKKIQTYATLHNMSGEAWVGQIYLITRNLYEDLGYL